MRGLRREIPGTAELALKTYTVLLEASIEASPGGEIATDQDAKHRVINSAIERQLRHHLYAPSSPTAVTMDDSGNIRMLNRGVRDATSGERGAIHNLNLT